MTGSYKNYGTPLTVLLLLLMTAPVLQSQPVLNGNGARGLAAYVRPGRAVDVRFSERGEVLIWWWNSGKWLRADGSDIERPLPTAPYDRIRRMLAVRDTNWIGLLYYEDRFLPGLSNIFLCAGHGQSIIDTSLSIAGTGSTSFNDVSMDYDALFSGFTLSGGAFSMARHQRRSGDNMGIPDAGFSERYLRWTPGSKSTIPVVSLNPENISDSTGYGYRVLMQDLLRASESKNDSVSIYRRRGGGRSSVFSSDSVYIESILLMDARSGALVDSCIIDTASAAGLNRSPRILPPLGGTVDIFRNDPANTGLYADRYSVNGQHLDHFLLTDRIVLDAPFPEFIYSVPVEDEIAAMSAMDYDILVLDDGSRLLAWTMPTGGNGSDCRIRMFDQNWNPVGFVKRIHEDTTGRQYNPVLAANGDQLFTRKLLVD